MDKFNVHSFFKKQYLNENMDREKMDQISDEIKKVTGIRSSVFETREGVYKVSFRGVRDDIEDNKFNDAIEYLKLLDYDIVRSSNFYDEGDRDEPAAINPYIEFKQ
tara:strand:+ start:271 stop:588 length:318 start_codon:yes stop_codon:yes gene_type:complete